jgi:hypothetical protein
MAIRAGHMQSATDEGHLITTTACDHLWHRRETRAAGWAACYHAVDGRAGLADMGAARWATHEIALEEASVSSTSP